MNSIICYVVKFCSKVKRPNETQSECNVLVFFVILITIHITSSGGETDEDSEP